MSPSRVTQASSPASSGGVPPREANGPRRETRRELAAEDGCASVPGRCLVWRDERFPSGASEANRSRTARSSPQGAGAKGWKAKVRPQEYEWAERQAVGG